MGDVSAEFLMRELQELQTIEQILGGAIPMHGSHYLQDAPPGAIPAPPSGVEYENPRGRKCIAKGDTCNAAKLKDHEYCTAHQRQFLTTGIEP